MLKPGFVFYFLFLFLTFFWTYPLVAQRPTKVESAALWTEMLINQRIKGKWSTQLDFQYRRRSEWWHLQEGMANPLALPLQFVVRPWLGYAINDQWTASCSPVGFWRNSNFKTRGKETLAYELRTSLQLAFQKNQENWRLSQRFRYEFRYRSDDVVSEEKSFSIAGADFPLSAELSRFRWQSRLVYQWSEKPWYWAVSTEWMLAIGKKVKPGNRFDQSRNLVAFGYRPLPEVRVETGYLFHWVMRQSDRQLNHCLFFQIMLENPFSQ